MSYCSKCGKEIATDAKFCQGCGTIVVKAKGDVENTAPRPIESKKTIFSIWIVVGLVVAGIMSFLMFSGGFSGGQSSSSSSQYQTPNCANVQVPYDAQEEYTEQVPYADQECNSRQYDAKAGYVSSDGQKSEWLIWSLYAESTDLNGIKTEEPLSGTAPYQWYITNYENKLGEFEIRVNYVDNSNDYLDSLSYGKIKVGPKETETGPVSFTYIYDNKPRGASGFYLFLVAPILEECNSITKYQSVPKSRTITKYRTEYKCS